jgi:hypothetical protein
MTRAAPALSPSCYVCGVTWFVVHAAELSQSALNHHLPYDLANQREREQLILPSRQRLFSYGP